MLPIQNVLCNQRTFTQVLWRGEGRFDLVHRTPDSGVRDSSLPPKARDPLESQTPQGSPLLNFCMSHPLFFLPTPPPHLAARRATR
ncbi:hypothetical protein FKM82_030463 [Ascaphus truei]